MPSARPSILYVSDLAYPAKGRRYCDEDILLTSRLRAEFDLAVCHPLDAAALMHAFDAVVVRNSGPVLNYQAPYEEFRERAVADGVRVYNQLSGKGDMAGKGYLLELTAAGYPVIPTIDRTADLGRLPDVGTYVVKPRRGADSIGLEFVARDRLADPALYGDVLVQPRVDFAYEVSFYFVDRTLQYALYAPRPDQRWALEPYEPTEQDREFAQRFVDWNDIEYGIQRVDACRAPDGELLLVELEDLNPYLSLDVLSPTARDAFVARVTTSLHGLIGDKRS
ncbi:hypothetical protein ACIP79_09150 [Streptomyces sp. NPDC088747]|uniref:hypothetical protein n=1 Tax=Streptomyces sp. NPDC088747 TaxID=3365886 RepID=UPI00382D4C03